MSGPEFIGVVRQRFPTIPVVVLSGEVPGKIPKDINPDGWFEKRLSEFPEIVRTIDELARKAPDYIALPQVVSVPVRVGPGAAGEIILTCTDCLRSFRAECFPGAMAGTAVCNHCNARVPFVIERSTPEKGQS
jgi:hypothetical protein